MGKIYEASGFNESMRAILTDSCSLLTILKMATGPERPLPEVLPRHSLALDTCSQWSLLQCWRNQHLGRSLLPSPDEQQFCSHEKPFVTSFLHLPLWYRLSGSWAHHLDIPEHLCEDLRKCTTRLPQGRKRIQSTYILTQTFTDVWICFLYEYNF